MQFTLIDFFIGFFLMNAMPHLLFGLLKIRFISAFGFSSIGNVVYAFINVAVAFVLFHIQYGIQELTNSGMVIGSGMILFMYLVSGRFFYNLFKKKDKSR